MSKSKTKGPVVILGAGPAGLTAALSLSKAGHKVVLIEKQSYLGGLSATFQYNQYRLDFGPHAYHCMHDDIDDIFHEFSSFGYRDIYMKASLLLEKKHFDYPLKFGQALFKLRFSTSIKMLTDYFTAQVKKYLKNVPEDSFEAWGIKRYGKSMFELAFGNYSRKVWGMPTTELSVKLAKQKLPDLNFGELLKEAFGGKGGKQKILYSSYAYPNKGIGIVFDNIGKTILKNNGKILFKSEPIEIKFKNDLIYEIIIKTKNGYENIPCSFVINTIPLNNFIPCCQKYIKSEYTDAAKKLIYRNLMIAYLEINKTKITDEIMVYLLDTDFTFNRFGEQKNICQEMIPKDKTILCFEVCSNNDDNLWNMPDTLFLNKAKEDLLKLNIIQDNNIINGFVKKIENAYPIYDLNFDKNLNIVFSFLENIENLYSIGRQGLFINNDIHTSMKIGHESAESYLKGQSKKIWNRNVRGYLDWRLI